MRNNKISPSFSTQLFSSPRDMIDFQINILFMTGSYHTILPLNLVSWDRFYTTPDCMNSIMSKVVQQKRKIIVGFWYKKLLQSYSLYIKICLKLIVTIYYTLFLFFPLQVVLCINLEHV